MKRLLLAAAMTAAGAILCACGNTVENTISQVTPTAPATDPTVPQTTGSTASASTSATTTTAETSTTSTAAATTAPAEPPESAVFTPTESVEVYSAMTISELIPDANVQFDDPEQKVDTSELGEKSTKIKFTYEDCTYEKVINYTVVDTTPPLVINSGWEPYAKLGEPLDINSIVGVADNYDRTPEIIVGGIIDTDTVGRYPLEITAVDDSGNSVSWDLEVLVMSQIPAPQDNNERVTYEDFMASHDYENVSYGIDVSAWQTNVDYGAVKDAGCEFVLTRIGYCYSEITMDDYYERNIEEATAADLDVGVYFYSTANSEESAREQAKWILEKLDGRELDFPIAFDWEEFGHFQKYGMNIHDVNDVFEAFCDEIEKGGYKAMLYSSRNFLQNIWENRNDRPVWLAHYVDETNYEGDFAIWQQSAYGILNGIDGDVDMNIRYNDMPLDY